MKPAAAPSLREKKPLGPAMDLRALAEIVRFMTPEKQREKLQRLNRRVKVMGLSHEVEVITDPEIDTWATTRVPKKAVDPDGAIVSTNAFRYIVIMPHAHMAIEDDEFLLGELRHELGHVLYTDWRMNQELAKRAESEGWPAHTMNSLTNCLEDPRMEHRCCLPHEHEGHVRRWFWRKNKTLILPNIGDGIEKMPPANQFDFLIKLYSLWKLHAEDAGREEILPWEGQEALHPRVREVWARVRPVIDRLVGVEAGTAPEMRSPRIREAIESAVWPAKVELMKEFGAGKPGKPESGQGQTCSGHSHNPDDPSGFPQKVQAALQKAIEGYKKAIDQAAQAQIERKKAAEEANQTIDKKQQERLQKIDGIGDSETRRQYLRLRAGAKEVQKRLERMFEKYFPRIAYPRETFGHRGKTYSAREHLKRKGTGLEKPLGKPNVPEKAGFVLQLIVDVSGSMYAGRINEVLKSVIAILEAAQDYPIHIEILASDHAHGGIDSKYILKAFDEEFSGTAGGRIKERLVNALTAFGGDNKDAESLQWAVPRIDQKKKELAGEYERLAALTIFLSDAEMEGQQDPEVVNALRKKVPILGGCIEPSPAIKAAVEKAYGPIGEGSFCPDSLPHFPQALEKILRKKIRTLFRAE